ncbi:MAG: polysialyltransferase family glycosyltransferase [Colwellia sp.]|jgi:Capsule polysaccharide biosynthesis protein.
MKVLMFDSWDVGLKYFDEFLEDIYFKDFEKTFLHMNSKIKDSLDVLVQQKLSTSKLDYINDVKSVDVEVYGSSVISALREEKPDFVIMLSITHFPNRLMVRACQKLNIPIFYMQHGVLFDHAQSGAVISQLKDSFKGKYLIKLKKLRKFTWFYKAYLTISRSPLESFKLAFQHLTKPFDFVWDPLPHRTLNVDAAFAFSNREADALVNVFKLNRGSVVVSGNPIIQSKLKKVQKSDIDQVSTFGDYALFLDQALTETNIVSKQDQLETLKELAHLLSQQDKRLVIKVHPRGNVATWSELEFENVSIVKGSSDLYSLIKYCKFAVGYNSTALIEALALDKNILTLSWFDDVRGEKIFSQASPFILDDKNELANQIKKLSVDNNFLCQELKDEYILPDGIDPMDRIRSIIQSKIRLEGQ